jgi:hypothetical protein
MEVVLIDGAGGAGGAVPAAILIKVHLKTKKAALSSERSEQRAASSEQRRAASRGCARANRNKSEAGHKNKNKKQEAEARSKKKQQEGEGASCFLVLGAWLVSGVPLPIGAQELGAWSSESLELGPQLSFLELGA